MHDSHGLGSNEDFVVKVKQQDIIIKLTDHSVVKGKINLYQRGSLANRLSDIFTVREEPFIVVFGIKDEYASNEIMIINKAHIMWISPVNPKSDQFIIE
jgi:hypothetical protein